MLGWSTRRLARPARLGPAAAGLLGLSLVLGAAPAARSADVATSARAVVRDQPATLATVVAVVPANGILFVHEEDGGWVRVTTRDGRTGWVPGSLQGTSLVPDERQAIGTGDLPGSLRVAEATELHASPALGSRVTARLAPGAAVSVRSRLGDWVSVTSDAGTGWLDLVGTPVFAAGAGSAPEREEAGRAPAAPAVAHAGSGAASDEAIERERRRLEREQARLAREAQEAEEARRAATEREERERREAEARAAREARRVAAAPAAPSPAAEAPASEAPVAPAAADATSDRRADMEARRAEREAAEAAERERKAEEARARRAEAEAARAARREAEAAAKPGPTEEPAPSADDAAAARGAARQQREAEAEARRQESEAARQQREADAEARRQAEAEARAQREAEAAARKQAEEQARAEREAARQAGAREPAQDAKDAARAAREEQERQRLEALQRKADEARARGPAQPVDIPPPVPVSIDEKAPNERKRDPASNPLVRQGVPTASQAAPPPQAAAAGVVPFDDSRQLERSVAALHDDRREALGLSTGEASPSRAPSVHVGSDAKPVQTTVVSQIVVRVNDEILTSGDFERSVQEALDELRRRSGTSIGAAEERAVRRSLLSKMIEQLILMEEGKIIGVQFDKVYDNAKTRFMKQAGINDDLELVQILEATGRTWDDFRRDLLRESVPPIVVQNAVYKDITVLESDIEAHYRMHQEEWAEEGCVRIREIVLQPEPRERTRDFNQRLETLLKGLESGADFCEMARRYSKAPSADDCGLLPNCFTRSQLDEKVALVAFRMKPGDVEPITTDWGFHVIRLEEAKARRTRPLSEVRDQIVDRLRGERGAEEMRRYIDRLREAAKIEIAPDYRDLLEGTRQQARSGGQ